MLKNKKGESEIGVGTIIILAITLIVGIIFFQVIAQQTGNSVNTITVVNETFAAPAALASSTFSNYRTLNDFVAINATGGEVIPTSNYTVANEQVVNGNLAATVTIAAGSLYASQNWNVSYTGEPTTYINTASGRAIANLIPLLFALAIAIISMIPAVRSKFLDMVKK